MRLNIQNTAVEDWVGWLRDVVLRIRMMIDNAHLGFGDGVHVDNIFGAWLTYTSNAVANTEDALAHNIGFVPVGFIVMNSDKAANFYKGGTAWTTSLIYLKSSTASTTATIFVVGPSNQAF